MLRKIMSVAAVAATLVLGTAAMSAPAEAKVHVFIGGGYGYGYPGWGYPGWYGPGPGFYDPYWGPPRYWRGHRHWRGARHCKLVKRWHHGQRVWVKKCRIR